MRWTDHAACSMRERERERDEKYIRYSIRKIWIEESQVWMGGKYKIYVSVDNGV
jgi:hypothetical protein